DRFVSPACETRPVEAALVLKAPPPWMATSVARTPFVRAQFVQTHSSSFRSLRYAALHRCGTIRARHARAPRVSLEPFVDPARLQTNRSSSTDAGVMEFPAFACGVNRVAADTGVLGAL